MNNKAIVLFSGGQDSTVCLLMAINEYGEENVEAISFTYNHQYRKDINCAIKICEKLGINHKIYDLGIVHDIANSNNIEGRNLILVSLVAVYAKVHEIGNIILGVAAEDTKGGIVHSDCSVEFVICLEKCIQIAIDENIRILTPLIKLTKKDIWKIADELGYLDLVKHETFSCWESQEKHCMKCKSCELRYVGLQEYERIKKWKIK